MHDSRFFMTWFPDVYIPFDLEESILDEKKEW